jgi:hypothetical protein
MRLFDLAKKGDFEVFPEEAQNLMGQILGECVEGLEKCWWGEGEGKPFHRVSSPWPRNWGLMWRDFGR